MKSLSEIDLFHSFRCLLVHSVCSLVYWFICLFVHLLRWAFNQTVSHLRNNQLIILSIQSFILEIKGRWCINLQILARFDAISVHSAKMFMATSINASSPLAKRPNRPRWWIDGLMLRLYAVSSSNWPAPAPASAPAPAPVREVIDVGQEVKWTS